MKKKLMLCLLVAVVAASCKKSGFSSKSNVTNNRDRVVETVTQTKATLFNTMFTRSTGGEWTGSDIDYSIPLPNGQVFWPMGDTFIDPINPPNATHPTRYHTNPGLLSSSIFISNGQGTTAPTYNSTLYNISGGFPVPYYPPVDDSTRRWSKDGVYYNNKIYTTIFVNRNVVGGAGIKVKLIRTDVAVINYPAYTVSSISIGSPSTSVIYGSCVMLDGNYIYIYGTESVDLGNNNTTDYMHVARLLKTNIAAGWTYYNGTSWVSNNAAAVRLKTGTTTLTDLTGISTEYKVFKHPTNGYYYLISQDPFFLGPNVYRYRSTSPTGPWNDKKLICTADLPTGTGFGGTPWSSPANTWTYDAKAHPEFKNGSSTDLLISYDVNNFDINKVIANADLYRPYFLWVSGWEN